MVACELLYDVELLRILVEVGGSDFNSVNSEDKMPLGILHDRLEKLSPGITETLVLSGNNTPTDRLIEMYTYLQSKGAVTNWRKIPKW